MQRPGPGGLAPGSVVISPAPELPPEEAVLHFYRPMPDPPSREYIQISDAKSPTPVTFNLREGVRPRSMSISGRELLFEAGSTRSALHDALISDAVRVLGHLFLGAAEPPPPGPSACGIDPIADDLGPCASEARL